MRADFEKRVAEHVTEILPELTALLGRARVAETVHRGVDHAAKYGLRDERNVCFFIDLVFIFGNDFDKRLQWASGILNAPHIADEHRKVQLLRSTAELQDLPTAAESLGEAANG
jgi:hypothetical protein